MNQSKSVWHSLWLSTFLSVFLIFVTPLAFAEKRQSEKSPEAKIKVGMEQKLGGTIPLDTEFVDEAGNAVALKELVDRPTILKLVYFQCPGICTPRLNSLRFTLNKIDLEPGIDFKVITIMNLDME